MSKYSKTVWKEITQDKTGHTVAKDFFKACSYVAGIFYLFVLVPAIILLTSIHIVLPLEVGLALLGGGLSLDIIKEIKGYNLRRTADDAGNPLATADSVEAPSEPVLMPTTKAPVDNACG